MSIFNSLQSLLAQTPEVPAPEEIAQTWQQKLSALSSLSFQQFMEQAISAILHGAVKIAIALAVFFIGKWIINRIYHFISKAFIRRNVELSLRSFEAYRSKPYRWQVRQRRIWLKTNWC